jgi:RHS repeat-associated protein
MLSDHLGSTLATTNTSGQLVSGQLYKAWGEARYTFGSLPTTYKYTGQREESSFGLYFYNAGWYDPVSGMFAQADTVVPAGVQGLDRFAYVNNSPLNYVDPAGHESKRHQQDGVVICIIDGKDIILVMESLQVIETISILQAQQDRVANWLKLY